MMDDPWVVMTPSRQSAPPDSSQCRNKEITRKTFPSEIANTSQPWHLLAPNDRGNRDFRQATRRCSCYRLSSWLSAVKAASQPSGDIVWLRPSASVLAINNLRLQHDPRFTMSWLRRYASGDGASVLTALESAWGTPSAGGSRPNRQTDPELRSSARSQRGASVVSLLPTLTLTHQLSSAGCRRTRGGPDALFPIRAGVFNEEHPAHHRSRRARQVGPLFKKAMLPDDAAVRAPLAVPGSTGP